MRFCFQPALILAFLLCHISSMPAQTPILGADVSFLASAEQQGIVFKEDGQPRDVLSILHEHQFKWVRLRLFVDPAANPDKLPNDLAYTLALAKRAHAQGFHLLLDLHYSDTWADPDKQFIPAAWTKLKHKQLVDQVFSYTRDTIATFAREGVMPEMVQVGNEITGGMLWPDGKLPDWESFSDLLKAGIRGVDAGRGTLPRPRIMIHIERSGDYDAATWYFDNLIAHHVPFDIIGLSYYPKWHGSVAKMRGNLHDLALRYHLPIIVAETASNWTPGDFIGKKAEFAESPEGQKAFFQAVAGAVRAVPNGLGLGLFWWEPAVPNGPIAGRALFDAQHNALPAIAAFDQLTTH